MVSKNKNVNYENTFQTLKLVASLTTSCSTFEMFNTAKQDLKIQFIFLRDYKS